MTKVAIVGAGLVGSLLAVLLAKRGYKVDVYERRPDMRRADISAGRSINLALSVRGWTALERAGVAEKIKNLGIPMAGRMIHDEKGKTIFQPYGKEGQAIYSVSRGELNKTLMSESEAHGKVDFHFSQKCIKVNLKSSSLMMQDLEKNNLYELKPDLIFGADGAFSRVRYGMQKMPLFDYSQSYLKHGYKELSIPPGPNGEHLIDKNSLHIWPRKSFMLIALPNLDGSFTCTLFAPFEGENSFEHIKTKQDVTQYFETHFNDAVPLMPALLDDFEENPTSSLVTVRCSPWTYNNLVLIGDASHAIVPFYGQGMNAGFEDCRVFDELLDKHGENWPQLLEEYNDLRKPDADAIADLALKNFIEMRDSVADPEFLKRKEIEAKIAAKYPKFMPLYSMVTFSNKRYSESLASGKKQKEMLDKIMTLNEVSLDIESDKVQAIIKEYLEPSELLKV